MKCASNIGPWDQRSKVEYSQYANRGEELMGKIHFLGLLVLLVCTVHDVVLARVTSCLRGANA